MSLKNNNVASLLNNLRETLPESYRSRLPQVIDTDSVKTWGSVINGDPIMRNEFLMNLQNLYVKPYIIAKHFKNPFSVFKKDQVVNGTIQEVAFDLIKAREFDQHKGAEREFARNLPDVRSTFHTVNVSMNYTVTIDDTYLSRAFTSIEAVGSLINNVVAQLENSAAYDEYLLIKYLVIKGVTKGRTHAIASGTTPKDIVKKARTLAQQLKFYSTKHNQAKLHTFTTPENLYILATAEQIAELDVEVLATAFNMDKTEFIGHVISFPDFDEFDNDRFSSIAGGQFEPVSADELDLMRKVGAILVDEEWFQVYDAVRAMTSVYNNAGMYTNYFYRIDMILSTSPFSNAITLTKEEIANPATLTYKVITVSQKAGNIVKVTLEPSTKVGIHNERVVFKQSAKSTEAGTLVEPYGEITFTKAGAQELEAELNGVVYKATAVDGSKLAVGATITFNKA